MSRADARAVDGVLLLDKPSGPTSNQALQRAKRLFGARKAGHAGTLDPLATGLLPLLFGEATKFAGWLSGAVKTYEATLLLGTVTTTGDLAGEIVQQQAAHVTRAVVESVLDRFRGTIFQIPPMYSALKVRGTPLYELARRGEVVERSAREVRIDELLLEDVRGDEVDIRVTCSKGTYIRVLGEEVGAALGCGATLKRLRRIGVGPFDLGSMHSFDEIERLVDADRIALLRPIEAGLEHLPKFEVPEELTRRLMQGQAVALDKAQHVSGTVRLYEAGSDRFIGLGSVCGDSIQPDRLVAWPSSPVPSGRSAQSSKMT